MENINLHFTGDFHAIGTAHNLLAAMIDNHIYWGNELNLDTRRIAWRRVVDMNDRALRSIVNSLGGVANGFPREDGFDITVASEVMAVFCLASDLGDPRAASAAWWSARPAARAGDRRAAQGSRADDRPAEGRADAEPGADAREQPGVHPRRPVRQHRPRLQLGHGDQARAQAVRLRGHGGGFGADLGAEKFFDIKCRKARLTPDAAVIVATIRALKMHGGVGRDDLGKENLQAVRKARQSRPARRQRAQVRRAGGGRDQSVRQRHRGRARPRARVLPRQIRDRGDRVLALGRRLRRHRGARRACREPARRPPALDGRGFRFLYPDEMPLWDKMRTIATEIYGAEDIIADKRVRDQFQEFQEGASATSRSASPRPNTASRPTPT